MWKKLAKNLKATKFSQVFAHNCTNTYIIRFAFTLFEEFSEVCVESVSCCLFARYRSNVTPQYLIKKTNAKNTKYEQVFHKEHIQNNLELGINSFFNMLLCSENFQIYILNHQKIFSEIRYISIIILYQVFCCNLSIY